MEISVSVLLMKSGTILCICDLISVWSKTFVLQN